MIATFRIHYRTWKLRALMFVLRRLMGTRRAAIAA